MSDRDSPLVTVRSGPPPARRFLTQLVKFGLRVSGMGHAGVVRGGLDGRAVALVGLTLVLTVTLGALAGSQTGVWAGVLGALAGLIPPAVLAVAIDRRARNLSRQKRKDEILGKYAPPKPASGGEDQG